MNFQTVICISVFQKLWLSDTCNQVNSFTKHGRSDQYETLSLKVSKMLFNFILFCFVFDFVTVFVFVFVFSNNGNKKNRCLEPYFAVTGHSELKIR